MEERKREYIRIEPQWNVNDSVRYGMKWLQSLEQNHSGM